MEVKCSAVKASDVKESKSESETEKKKKEKAVKLFHEMIIRGTVFAPLIVPSTFICQLLCFSLG